MNEGPDFQVVVDDVPVPEIGLSSSTDVSRNEADRNEGPDDVLLRLNATGICYSDLHYMMNDLGFYPMSQHGVRSPGHEGAGVVVAVGSNVKNWKIGDRGGVKPTFDVCMNCDLCWDGKHETYCEQSLNTGLDVAGTYQQYLASPAKYTSRIPDGVDDFVAGPIMCSGSTIYRSVRMS